MLLLKLLSGLKGLNTDQIGVEIDGLIARLKEFTTQVNAMTEKEKELFLAFNESIDAVQGAVKLPIETIAQRFPLFLEFIKGLKNPPSE